MFYQYPVVDMKNFLLGNWANISVLVGVALVAHEIFNFSFYDPVLCLGSCKEHYYYAKPTLTLIALGAALVVLGLLRLKRRSA